MTIQYAVDVRNARLDAVESVTGVSAKIKLFSGTLGANCAAADPTGLLVTITLPVDWMSAAAVGVKVKLGTWSDTAIASGTAVSFRLYESTGATCKIQGNVTATGGGGDLTLSATAVIVAGQSVTVSTFSLTAGNP